MPRLWRRVYSWCDSRSRISRSLKEWRRGHERGPRGPPPRHPSESGSSPLTCSTPRGLMRHPRRLMIHPRCLMHHREAWWRSRPAETTPDGRQRGDPERMAARRPRAEKCGETNNAAPPCGIETNAATFVLVNTWRRDLLRMVAGIKQRGRTRTRRRRFANLR